MDIETIFSSRLAVCGPDLRSAKPGRYITHQVGRYGVIIVRGQDGAIRAFHKSCRHRGSVLCMAVDESEQCNISNGCDGFGCLPLPAPPSTTTSTRNDPLPTETISSRPIPAISPSGAQLARHKGQRHCPGEDRFELVCNLCHPSLTLPAQSLFPCYLAVVSGAWVTPSARETCLIPRFGAILPSRL